MEANSRTTLTIAVMVALSITLILCCESSCAVHCPECHYAECHGPTATTTKASLTTGASAIKLFTNVIIAES
jgi:hypothetical protein